MSKAASFDLKGKIAFITGGSKGMGLGIARTFLACGAGVAICSNDPASLAEAVDRLEGGNDFLAVEADVSNEADVERAISTTVDRFGGLNLLVNSAGIQRYGKVTSTPEEVWDEVMTVNLKGIYLVSRFGIPHLERAGGGAVINLASVQAYASQANVAAYTASKGGILALTRAMALDHAHAGIRVNAICPAAIDTPMLRWAADIWKGSSTPEATVQAWGEGHPVGRVGTIGEVAAVAAFLASDLCPFMTGADIKVDGGVLSKLGIVLPESTT